MLGWGEGGTTLPAFDKDLYITFWLNESQYSLQMYN